MHRLWLFVALFCLMLVTIFRTGLIHLYCFMLVNSFLQYSFNQLSLLTLSLSLPVSLSLSRPSLYSLMRFIMLNNRTSSEILLVNNSYTQLHKLVYKHISRHLCGHAHTLVGEKMLHQLKGQFSHFTCNYM